MRVKNISARPHHIGNVTVIPGEEKDIPDEFASAINKAELVEVADKVSEQPMLVKKSGKSNK